MIKFGAAFAWGCIAAAAGVAYVAVWEVYLAMTDYKFMDDYIAGIVRAGRPPAYRGQRSRRRWPKWNRCGPATPIRCSGFR